MRPPTASASRSDGDVRGADELEHDVEGAAVDERIRRDDLGAADARPDRGDIVAQVRIANRRGHACAGERGELHAGDADSARSAVHEGVLTHARARTG